MNKLFSMVPVFAALFLGLNACSDDDGGSDIPQTPSKKLVKIEVYDDNNDLSYVETFTYDNQGRWIRSERDLKQWLGEKPDMRVRTLTYSDNNILYSDSYKNYNEVFEIDNNKIKSRYREGNEEDVYTYHYSDSYLVKIGEDYADFEYTAGNLTKYNGYWKYEITYTNIPDKLGLNVFEPSYTNEYIQVYPNNPLYQSGYTGKRSKNLIKTIKSNYSSLDGDYTYSYKLDKDGYVTEMVENDSYRDNTYKFYYE